ncbi:alcohol dehydrogenase [Agromyces protaetiae]|uniref:alcohol dehydrogenase n=1 Tax=Agromyces protaetiae TaxID=2509455 RepID=A0A4P6FKP5_9MICO|nr:alcohol dehydrogenase catalytic domain-containing protein [Agromyces protaetiae]QAY74557.1 alcohol dehydrogenase [Agromyces protaetiae]
MPHTLRRLDGRALLVDPAPVAMVWNEPGRPHDALAVPGLTLGPGDALIEVELATVCGSDLHTVRGDRSAETPLVLGHEAVGRVVAAGERAVRSDGTRLELGDRVVWSVTASCGSCDRCARGLPQKCRTLAKYGHARIVRGWELSGGFATHVQLREGTAIVPVGEALPASVAAPASCATATAVAALDAAAGRVPLAGATVVVAGAGMVGLSVAALADDVGATVVVSDPDPGRRAFALRFGAVAVADPSAPTESDASLRGVLDRLSRSGVDAPLVAVEASGSPAAVRQAIDAVDVGGVVVLVGSVFPGPDVAISPESLIRRLVTVQGVHNYAPHHLEEAVAALHRLRRTRPFDEFVGATFSLAELDTAIEAAASGAHVRVGIAPQRRRHA